ncbi:peptide maturation system protein (TIGR04066 family) [Anaerobacterium chartisolvens]|uniref:Peptide maturation system protein (TIGR04066 family) n=1 Tax=Anaerobacterium chartisolvens TaxID=1297424 RepID=A0A369AVF3_9FIRM|nr:TIGR04066 family peptide maturation system protein [Anaerobacterium chartisolvens]RCX12216.1 peptide maturation system protein (TIGR04066 family) [Anaerobacterium chartisolvens]
MNGFNKTRVAVYPYDNEMYPYLKYKSMLENIDIRMLLSPAGWALGSKKACGYEIKTMLTADDYSELDALWITDSINKLQEEHLYEVIEEMLRNGKQIILSRKIHPETYYAILETCKRYSGALIDKSINVKDFTKENIPLSLQEIYTPIVCVAGIGERTDKFLVQLGVKHCFEKMGYDVAMVSSRTNSIFLNNVHAFPAFMEGDLPAEYKIVLFNHFIKEIEQLKEPEVIIVGIPEGIMPMSKLQVGYFGIHAFEIFNAITPDFLALCLYGNDISDLYLSEMKKIIQYRFQTNVDSFYLSNTMQDVFTVNRAMPIEYFARETENIRLLVSNLEAAAGEKNKIYTELDIEAMVQQMVKQLNEYSVTEVL